MVVELHKTERAECDLVAVAELVNRLQYFFVARPSATVVSLSPAFDKVPLLDPADFARWFQSVSRTPSSNYSVLITSCRLNLDRNKSLYHFGGKTAIISDYFWNTSPAMSALLLARYIIHAGMATFGCHVSRVDSCVCAQGQDFDCLCTDCESRLRSFGYRDGIARLHETFNSFNQIIWQPDTPLPELRRAASHQNSLRLATSYAEEISQEAQQHTLPLPFDNIILLVVLHFLSDLIPFVEALNKMGCRYGDMYLVAKPYPYAHRDEVNHNLESRGVTTLRASKSDSVDNCADRILSMVMQRSEADDKKKILVIEDGGYFAPLLHQPQFSKLLERCIGIVEQTQHGANNDRNKIGKGNIRVPILSVAESDFKKVYESPEIGRVAIQNIARFTPNIKLSGRHAVLFGFGSVGQEVAFHLNNAFNMTVSVVDDKDLAVLRALHRKAIVAEAEKKFQDLRFGDRALLVVGTTGNLSIDESVLKKLPDGAVLVSTSSDRVEIAVDVLERLAGERFREVELGKHEYTIDTAEGGTKKLFLLAEGYPINFYGSESLPNDAIDPVMTLLLLSGAELAIRHRDGRPFLSNDILTNEVNDITDERKLVTNFLRLLELS
jgi:S-adenosylhomocysteine hydrolase